MGYQLAGEVLDHAPNLPYREFRILMALALDATDGTRLAMPGHELLVRRGNCSMRTVGRVIGRLEARGFVTVKEHPGPGRRAVYAIPPMPGTPATEVADEHRSLPVAGEHRPSEDQHRPSRRRTPATPVAAPKSIPESKSSPRAWLLDLGAALAKQGGTDDEIDSIVKGIKNNPDIGNPAAYVRKILGNDGGAGLLARTRRELDAHDAAGWSEDPPPVAKPPHCGECDPQTRLVELPDGRMARCIRCHPLSIQPPTEAQP